MRFAERVYWLVARIPRGQVMTYGQVALALGAPRAARMVGGALRHCPDPEGVPWQRVVNARGGISPRQPEYSVHLQAALLRAEGVRIWQDGPLYFLDLDRYAWWPEPALLAELAALTASPPAIGDRLPYAPERPQRYRPDNLRRRYRAATREDAMWI